MLYCQVPPLGENLTTPVEPLQVEDLLLADDNMEWAVRMLSTNRSKGHYGIRAEQLWEWLREDRKAETETEAESELRHRRRYQLNHH